MFSWDGRKLATIAFHPVAPPKRRWTQTLLFWQVMNVISKVVCFALVVGCWLLSVGLVSWLTWLILVEGH